MDTARVRTKGRLPTFAIIGAPRAGTTSLARYLGAHPEVFISPQKELYFFGYHFKSEDLDWYRDQFVGAGDDVAVGEATPWYLYSKDSLAEMAEVLPDARLIAILRNPIDRAFSQYWYQHWKHRRPNTFDEMVDLVSALSWQDELPGFARYFDVGLYQRQLEQVCSYFPRESLHVLLFEDLVADPKATFAGVCRFLGVDDSTPPSGLGRQYNAAPIRRSDRLHRTLKRWDFFERAPRLGRWIDKRNTRTGEYPAMDPATRAKLIDWYAEPNAALAAWLGRDLSVWQRE